MMTDVVLDDDRQEVRVECDNLTVKGHDFILDSAERRDASGESGYRRALVHGENDSLIINFGGDYPAGVVLQGSTQITEITPTRTAPGSLPSTVPDLVVHGGITYETKSRNATGQFVRNTYSVNDELDKLSAMVAALAARVAALEG